MVRQVYPASTMLDIFESTRWTVSHRSDSRYAGHLIVASKGGLPNISDLSSESLNEIGSVLAKAEKLLKIYCNPHRVVVAKFGFSEKYSCHFHVLPVSHSFLKEIADNPKYADEPDGNDALLFASREYCERPLSQDEEIIQLQVVRELRNLLIRVD